MADYIWLGTSSTAWATGGNWSPSGPPSTSGDTATFDGRAIAALVGSNQSSTTLTRLDQFTSMSSAIGTYSTMMQVGATVCNLGLPAQGSGTGTPAEVALNFGSVQTLVNVYATASSGTNNLPPVLLKGSHASNVLNVYGDTQAAIVGVAEDVPGSIATFVTVNVLGQNANVTLGAGCTLTTINQSKGTALVKAAATTITQTGGKLTTQGSGAVTTVNVSGTVVSNSSGTITTLSVASGGIADFSGSRTLRTVTNCTVYGSGKIYDPYGVVTFTNGVILSEGAKSTQLELGPRTITPS